MVLSDAELVEFRSRCIMAAQRGYPIACADAYMMALTDELGLEVEADPSAEQLAEAAALVIEARSTGKKPVKRPKAKPKDEPKADKPKAVAKDETPKPVAEDKAVAAVAEDKTPKAQ